MRVPVAAQKTEWVTSLPVGRSGGSYPLIFVYLLCTKRWEHGNEQGRQPCPCSAHFAKELAGPSQVAQW